MYIKLIEFFITELFDVTVYGTSQLEYYTSFKYSSFDLLLFAF